MFFLGRIGKWVRTEASASKGAQAVIFIWVEYRKPSQEMPDTHSDLSVILVQRIIPSKRQSFA